jgi:hypothetical protein
MNPIRPLPARLLRLAQPHRRRCSRFRCVLVFASTLAQVDPRHLRGAAGIGYRTWIAIWRMSAASSAHAPAATFIGSLLLANLVAAHIYRLKFEWRKAGIQLTHAGIIVLLIGELLTGILAGRFPDGDQRGRNPQLLREPSATTNSPSSTPAIRSSTTSSRSPTPLARLDTVQHPRMPFRVVTKAYYPNSALARRHANTTLAESAAVPRPHPGHRPERRRYARSRSPTR